jgi:hypothetical protein
MRRFIVLLGLAGLAACGFGNDAPIVIDGSSPEAFERTLGEARRDLGPQDRVKFKAALTEFRAQMFAKADTRQDYQRLVREGMDGLTAPRIVDKFNENANKAKNDAADAIFDAKRAVAGRGQTTPKE